MTNREMFLLATSILFASTTAGMALQGVLNKGPHHGPRPGFERSVDRHGPDSKRGPRHDFFADADADKDGFVTREEMTTRQQARLDDMFTTVDTDRDGKLSKDEMEKGRDLMRAKWKAKFDAERNAAPEVAPASTVAPAPAPAVAQ